MQTLKLTAQSTIDDARLALGGVVVAAYGPSAIPYGSTFNGRVTGFWEFHGPYMIEIEIDDGRASFGLGSDEALNVELCPHEQGLFDRRRILLAQLKEVNEALGMS